MLDIALARIPAFACLAHGFCSPVLAALSSATLCLLRLTAQSPLQVHMKLKDLEPEQLPADFSTAVQSQLKPW